MEILEINDNVPDSAFEWPADYTEVSNPEQTQ
jgi:hypothetical protein